MKRTPSSIPNIRVPLRTRAGRTHSVRRHITSSGHRRFRSFSWILSNGFANKKSTSPADIEEWAKELGAGEVTRITLAGAQFRCAGSTEYVEWVEALLAGASSHELAPLSKSWIPQTAPAKAHRHVRTRRGVHPHFSCRSRARHRSTFEFAVCETPSELESLLRSKLVGNATARLVVHVPGRGRPRTRIGRTMRLYTAGLLPRWSEGGRERTVGTPLERHSAQQLFQLHPSRTRNSNRTQIRLARWSAHTLSEALTSTT